MCSTDDIFANLQDDLDTAASRHATTRPAHKHPCGECGGTGRWSRGINRHGSGHCFACKGKGYLKIDKETCLKIDGGRLTPEPEKQAQG